MKHRLALALAALALSTTGWSETRQADPPLVVNGDLSLTTRDFEAYLEKVPEKLRSDFRSNIDRVTKTVDGLWVQRVAAKRALDAGLANDPIVAARMRQAQEAVLVEAYLRKLDADMKIPDLRTRAREVYDADPNAFKAPGKIHVQHILVEAKTRPHEDALKRAKEVHAEAAAGKEAFTAIARRVSDDPTKEKNSGDLGPQEPSKLDPQFVSAIASLKPGEVSAPFETKFGFHIVKLVNREPERVRPFEEVREAIIAAEKDKIIDAARNRLLAEIRNDPKNFVHMENVEALTGKPPAATASSAVDSKTR
jgi:peptidyl-prolyl cis-trans isomerase C